MNAISSVARRSLHFYAFGLIAALFLIPQLSAADVVMTQTLPAYGGGLDVDGDVALVGDPGNDDQGEDVGAVHVLSRIAGRWTETDIFYPADPSTATGFGQDIALDGARALIVASGEAFIVELQDGIWVQQDQLLPDCAPACDTYFRSGSLALSQDHAALGAWRAGSSGLVYIFKKRRAGWRQEALLEPTDKRVSELRSVRCAGRPDTRGGRAVDVHVQGARLGGGLRLSTARHDLDGARATGRLSITTPIAAWKWPSTKVLRR